MAIAAALLWRDSRSDVAARTYRPNTPDLAPIPDLDTTSPTMGQPNQVEAVRTAISADQAKKYLSAAFTAAFKRTPSKYEIAMLLAQSALETRDWKAMWNWNFGNVNTSQKYPWFDLRDGHKYRAFTSPEQGALYFILFLKRRYPTAWALLGTRDPRGFAEALKSGEPYSYYEGDVNKYASYLETQYVRYA